MTILENQTRADIPTLLYMELEELLMQNIARHCRDWGKPIATDEWLLLKLAEIGKLNQENLRLIGSYSGSSRTAIERMLNEATEDAIKHLEPGFKKMVEKGLVDSTVTVGKSRNIQQIMRSFAKQAKETTNLCNTTMLYKARDGYKKMVTDIAKRAKEIENKQDFLDILNKNATAMTAGAYSRQQAMVKCIEEFNAKGIPAFVDKKGREWTPEAYVNMNLRTASSNTAHEVQFARFDDYEIDLIEVDSHSGARPKCARDQGKIFDRANKSDKYPHWNTSSYGEPDGLLGINCGHHVYPYIEGVSIRRYFPTEDMDANDKLYKETQVQRALERDVRKQKRECMLLKEAGNEEAFKEASAKLSAKRKRLENYVDSNPKLHRRKNREQVVGFDKKVSGRAVGANRKYVAKYDEYKYNENGNIIVTDDWSEKGKVTIPKKYRPYAVVETIENKKGIEYRNRTFYDEKAQMIKQVHSGNHANPKQHPYGKNGEHSHDYEWENGKIINRRTREITETERKENGDIL